MNREKTSPLGYYTIGIAALFLLGFLLLIVLAAGVYRDTVTSQDDNNQIRALRSYLVTCVRSADAEDVTLEQADGGQVLVIRDAGSGYGLRIFQAEGMLKETYGSLARDLDIEAAEDIAPTEVFEAERLSRDVLTVTTDAGRAILHIGGVAASAASEEAQAAGLAAGGEQQ